MTRDDALDVVWAFIRSNPIAAAFARGLLDVAFEPLSICLSADADGRSGDDRGPISP